MKGNKKPGNLLFCGGWLPGLKTVKANLLHNKENVKRETIVANYRLHAYSISRAAGGRLFTMNRTNRYQTGRGQEPDAKKRGMISDFSHNSRKRLMQFCSSLNIEKIGLPDFVTVTYPSEWPEESTEWKKHLQIFFKRLDREFPGCALIWRLEPQKRGAPHFHMAVWGAGRIMTSEGKQWLSRQWFEVVGSGDEKHLRAGTSVEPVETWEKWISYVSKYMAKVGDKSRKQVFDYDVGRYWGVRNKKRLQVDIEILEVSVEKFIRIRRVLKKMMNAEKRRRGLPVRKFRHNLDVPGLWCMLRPETAGDLVALFENEDHLPF